MKTSAVASLDLADTERTHIDRSAAERSAPRQPPAQGFGQRENEPELDATIPGPSLAVRSQGRRHDERVNRAATRMTPHPRVAGRGALGRAVLGRLDDLLSPFPRDQRVKQVVGLLERGEVTQEMMRVRTRSPAEA